MIKVTDFLAELILFKDLTTDELAVVEEIIYPAKYQNKEILFMEGDVGDAIYFIEYGLVKIFKTSSQGQEKTLALLKRGDFFGEMAVFNQSLRSASARIMKDSKLLVMGLEEFQEILTDNSDLALKIVATLAKRLKKANQEIKQLTFNSVEERLVKVLLKLQKKHGVKQKKGILISEQLTHQELANLVGSTRGTITKLLNKLAQEDKIINKQGYILLKDQFFEQV